MLKYIIDPDSINVFFFFCDEEGSETLNRVIFETPTKFIAIGHVKSPKTLFMVHVKLSLIIAPVGVGQIETPISSLLSTIFRNFIMQNSEPMKGIALPAARVANFATRIIEHSVSIEFPLGVEFSLILSSV